MGLFNRHDSGYGYYSNTSGLSNACKTILANIRFMDVDSPICSIVITSAVPNEGKSFVAENLCRAIASSGETVLLVEADMRRPTLAGRLGAHAQHGIYAVLSGAASLSEAVVPTETPNMYFLDAEPGIPNPSDLFNSRQFERFVPAISEAYDFVVFDTPPVGAFVDSAVLSRLVDASFLVVREGFVRREQVVAAYDQLVKAGGNVGGVIMNYCERSGGDYYYYSHYYYGHKSDDPNSDGSEKKHRHHHHHHHHHGPSLPDKVGSHMDSSVASISGDKTVSSSYRMPSVEEVMAEQQRQEAYQSIGAVTQTRSNVPSPDSVPSPVSSGRPSALDPFDEA